LRDELYLVIGCFGRRDDNFVSCCGVENRILQIKDSLNFYNDMMDYFEAVRLFDKPMFDFNAIRHFMHNMQDRYDQRMKRLWEEKTYSLIERFILTHKSCGVYVKLILVNPEFDQPPKAEPDSVIVPKTLNDTQKPIPPLKVVRSRR